MGTLLGDALARAGLVSRENADRAARMAEEDRKRREAENIRRKYAAEMAEMEALKAKGLGNPYDPSDEEEFLRDGHD